MLHKEGELTTGSEKNRMDLLLAQRQALEVEAKAISDHLESTPVGIKGSLVDNEGFPLNNVDIFDIRAKRQRLACIQTDYKQLMADIEREVLRMHALNRPKEEEKHQDSSHPDQLPPPPQFTEKDVKGALSQSPSGIEAGNNRSYIPFALIDEVFEGSPAQEAGIKVGDLLLKFGNADHSNHRNLVALVDVVSNNVGRAIDVTVERAAVSVEVQLTPHSWPGRGLVGCHFQPIQR